MEKGAKLEPNMVTETNPSKIKRRAGELRHNQTEAEARLWSQLRAHRLAGTHFRRQHAIGSYIVDFCAPRIKLVIELDGGQHLDQEEYDQKRTAFLESMGFQVLRFWNNEVLGDIVDVMKVIDQAVRER